MIWTEKMDRKYSRRTKAIYQQSIKWKLMCRGFVILGGVVFMITRPAFGDGNWVAVGIIGALFLAGFCCIGMLVYHCVRFLRSCAVDRRRRKAGLPLDEPEATGMHTRR